MIKSAKVDDINKIIELHLSSFGMNHFSAVFSKKMLEKYFALLLSMNEFNYVYYNEDDETLMGYIIAGYKSQDAVNKFTKENFWYLVFTLIKNPKFINEKINELIIRIRGDRKERKAKCRLYLIGVNTQFKGQGIGKKLINYLEAELKQSGIKNYGLSVRKENKEAIGFYDKSGYTVAYEDAKSIYYFKEL